jgi:hypothetical protein
MQRLAEIGLKSKRGFGCLPRLFTEEKLLFVDGKGH